MSGRALPRIFARVGPLALALVPFGALAIWHVNWAPAAEWGDFAQYILHAQTFLNGKPYTDIGYIYTPETASIGPAAYPPGLPIVLAPILALSGVHMGVLRLFTLSCMIAFGALAYARLSRVVTAPVAAAGVGLALFDIEAKLGTLVPMSDVPFCALAWLLIWVADRQERWSWSRTTAVTVLGFAMIGFRLAGVAIVPALALFGLLGWRRRGLRPLVPVAIWVAAGLAAIAFGVFRNPYPNVAGNGMDLALRLFNLRNNYRHVLPELVLYPFPANLLNDIYHLLIAPVVIVGGFVVLRRLGASLLSCFAAAYAGMLLAVQVGEMRYVWPFLPILGASFAQGLVMLNGRFSRRKQPEGSSVVVVPRAALAVLALLMTGALVRQLSVPGPFAITGTPDATNLYHWLAEEHARRPARAMFHNPRVVTLLSGVPAKGLPDRSAPGQLVSVDQWRISHLVWQQPMASSCVQRLANQLPALYPERFELAFENATFRVYRVRPTDTPFRGKYERIDWRRPNTLCGSS